MKTPKFLPAAFTPNDDNNNDILYARGAIQTLHFEVYNQWGVKIFETNNTTTGWDGKYQGADQPIGNYVWKAVGSTFDGRQFDKKGVVLLIR